MIDILALTLAAAQAAAPAPPAPAAVPATPPADWSHLPPLPWREAPQVTPDLAAFVEAEVSAGRCASAGSAITVDIAVAVRGDGLVRAAVPRAIDCPTVEQFAAGLITSFARNNLRHPAAGWYRVSLTFDRGR